MNSKLKGLLLDIFPQKIISSLKKVHYCRALRRFDEGKEPDLAIIKYIIDKGDTVIDIGANVGWYTKYLSDLVAETGKVISIEPIPETFSILCYCVKKLKMNNVKLYNYAISDTHGMCEMEVPKYDFGGFNYYQSRIISNNQNKISSLKYFSVITECIDNILEELGNKVSFIKCDVEGNELNVIKGALKVISKNKPVWLIELSSDPDENDSYASKLVTIMQENGYSPYWFNKNRLYKRLVGHKSTNYFFFTLDHLREMIEIRQLLYNSEWY